MLSSRRTVLLLVGSAALIVTGLIIFTPNLLRQVRVFTTLIGTFEKISQELLIRILSSFAFLAALWWLGKGASEQTPAHSTFLDSPPEERVLNGPIVGDDFTKRVKRATSVPDGVLNPSNPNRVEEIRETLQSDAAAVYRFSTGCSHEEATTAIEVGEWTDNPLPASFLASSESAPKPPVREILREWIAPEQALRRKIDHTVDEIVKLAGNENLNADVSPAHFFDFEDGSRPLKTSPKESEPLDDAIENNHG